MVRRVKIIRTAKGRFEKSNACRFYGKAKINPKCDIRRNSLCGFEKKLYYIPMIDNFVQPKNIVVAEDLQLVKYYPRYKQTLEWYQDLDVCKQVDNIDFPYDLARLKAMYNALAKGGECYYIKVKVNGKWRLAGDISLFKGEICIAICKQYQNRHFGRRAVAAMLERAKEIGLDHVECEIYDFNLQSRKMFESVGFEKYAHERYRKFL